VNNRAALGVSFVFGRQPQGNFKQFVLATSGTPK
jgi:hypothetical protein